jgi:hypothetical protein
MRGSDVETAGLFSYVRCEARVPTSQPLRPISAIVCEVLEGLSPISSDVFGDWSPVDPAGEAAARPVVAGLLQDTLGAPAHGA